MFRQHHSFRGYRRPNIRHDNRTFLHPNPVIPLMLLADNLREDHLQCFNLLAFSVDIAQDMPDINLIQLKVFSLFLVEDYLVRGVVRYRARYPLIALVKLVKLLQFDLLLLVQVSLEYLYDLQSTRNVIVPKVTLVDLLVH